MSARVTPPHNLDAEQGVLGAILYDNATLAKCQGLRAEHFYDPVHGVIFEAIAKMVDGGHVADGVTLRAHFAALDCLQDIGGAKYLLTLLENAARMPVHAQEYASLIVDAALRRDMVRISGEVAILAVDPTAPGEMALLEAQRAFGALDSEAGGEAAWRSAGEIAASAVERAYAGSSGGISTGLPTLDDCTGGGRPGSLWVIGGATSMGKSIGGQQIAVNVAKQGYGVAYVHLEMDLDEVGLRLASALAFDNERVRYHGEGANPHYLSAVRQKLLPAQWDRMRAAATKIAPSLQIYVDDRPGRTVTQIESATRTLFQKMRRDGVKPGLIVVDHEGLIAAEAKHPSELESARARSNRLKDMAKRLGVWTVALSQITKEGSRADGEDRLPTSQDLNYGSALSQAAHVVILLHRKAYYAERKPQASRSERDLSDALSRETTLVVDKARGGRRAQVEAIMDVASAVLIEAKGNE